MEAFLRRITVMTAPAVDEIYFKTCDILSFYLAFVINQREIHSWRQRNSVHNDCRVETQREHLLIFLLHNLQ